MFATTFNQRLSKCLPGFLLLHNQLLIINSNQWKSITFRRIGEWLSIFIDFYWWYQWSIFIDCCRLDMLMTYRGFSSPNPLGQPVRHDVWCAWTTCSSRCRCCSYCTRKLFIRYGVNITAVCRHLLPPGWLSWKSAGLLSGKSRVRTSRIRTKNRKSRLTALALIWFL